MTPIRLPRKSAKAKTMADALRFDRRPQGPPRSARNLVNMLCRPNDPEAVEQVLADVGVSQFGHIQPRPGTKLAVSENGPPITQEMSRLMPTQPRSTVHPRHGATSQAARSTARSSRKPTRNRGHCRLKRGGGTLPPIAIAPLIRAQAACAAAFNSFSKYCQPRTPATTGCGPCPMDNPLALGQL